MTSWVLIMQISDRQTGRIIHVGVPIQTGVCHIIDPEEQGLCYSVDLDCIPGIVCGIVD